jgi:hypothetical protein
MSVRCAYIRGYVLHISRDIAPFVFIIVQLNGIVHAIGRKATEADIDCVRDIAQRLRRDAVVVIFIKSTYHSKTIYSNKYCAC